MARANQISISGTPSENNIPTTAVDAYKRVDELPDGSDQKLLASAKHLHVCPMCQKTLARAVYAKYVHLAAPVWVQLLTPTIRHINSHMKPFKCSVLSCRRSVEGFASTSDCRRHEMFKHNLHANDRRKLKAVDCIPEYTTLSILNAFEAVALPSSTEDEEARLA